MTIPQHIRHDRVLFISLCSRNRQHFLFFSTSKYVQVSISDRKVNQHCLSCWILPTHITVFINVYWHCFTQDLTSSLIKCYDAYMYIYMGRVTIYIYWIYLSYKLISQKLKLRVECTLHHAHFSYYLNLNPLFNRISPGTIIKFIIA